MREKGHNPRLFRRLPSVAFHARHVFPFSPGPDLLPKPAIDFNFQKSRRHIFFDLCNTYEGDDIIECVCVCYYSFICIYIISHPAVLPSLSLSQLFILANDSSTKDVSALASGQTPTKCTTRRAQQTSILCFDLAPIPPPQISLAKFPSASPPL